MLHCAVSGVPVRRLAIGLYTTGLYMSLLTCALCAPTSSWYPVHVSESNLFVGTDQKKYKNGTALQLCSSVSRFSAKETGYRLLQYVPLSWNLGHISDWNLSVGTAPAMLQCAVSGVSVRRLAIGRVEVILDQMLIPFWWNRSMANLCHIQVCSV